jgi:hypothetical protein
MKKSGSLFPGQKREVPDSIPVDPKGLFGLILGPVHSRIAGTIDNPGKIEAVCKRLQRLPVRDIHVQIRDDVFQVSYPALQNIHPQTVSFPFMQAASMYPNYKKNYP